MVGVGFIYGVKQQADRPHLAVRASHGQVQHRTGAVGHAVLVCGG
jgi:hypothetical protein